MAEPAHIDEVGGISRNIFGVDKDSSLDADVRFSYSLFSKKHISLHMRMMIFMKLTFQGYTYFF